MSVIRPQLEPVTILFITILRLPKNQTLNCCYRGAPYVTLKGKKRNLHFTQRTQLLIPFNKNKFVIRLYNELKRLVK